MKKGEGLSKAIVLAVNRHEGQFDKGGNPYILHLMKVMHYTKSDDEEIQQIAVMHDIIEDTDTTYLELVEMGFSERVIQGVMCMTKQRGQTYDQYRKQVLSNKDAMIVKSADLRHNSDIRRLKGVTDKDIARITKYHMFYLEIQAELQKTQT